MTMQTHCGFVTIIGRPNVGKSTLLNHILGKKISITSRKPQTTRHRLLGVSTDESVQIVFVDTPGLHQQAKKALNQYMNKAALSALHDVDLIIFLIDGNAWQAPDQWVLQYLANSKIPVMLVLNKIDTVKPREKLLPLIETLQHKFNFKAMVPISAKTGEGVAELLALIKAELPASPFYFPAEQITDRNDEFIITETIREKLMRNLGQELPYALTVSLDAFEAEDKIIRMAATIWVEKEGQKPIVIGQKGSHLKKIGQQARMDLERYFGKQVYLQLWVKVKGGWSDDVAMLRKFGYDE